MIPVTETYGLQLLIRIWTKQKKKQCGGNERKWHKKFAEFENRYVARREITTVQESSKIYERFARIVQRTRIDRATGNH